jgi:hypothetical protein
MSIKKEIKTNKNLLGVNLEFAVAFLFIVWQVANIFIRFEPLNNFPNDDSAVFLYIGRGILKGQVPYLDIWDHKGPLLYFIDALGIWIYGLWGVWIIQFILTIVGLFIAYLALRKEMGSVAALIGVLSGYYLLDLFSAGNITEEYSSVFALLAFGLFILYTHGYAQKAVVFWMGALLMCTFLTRPNNIGFQFAIILALGATDILNKDIHALRKKIIEFGIGMLVVLVPFLFYFWLNNALDNFFDQAYRYNLVYVETSQAGSNFIKFLHPPFRLITFIAITSYGAVLLNVRKIFNREKSLKDENAMLLLLLSAFPIEFFLSNISGRGYNHYYLTWIPYFVVASGYLASQVLRALPLSDEKNKFLLPIIVLGYLLIYPPQKIFIAYMDIGNHFVYERSNGIEKNHPVSDFIHDNTTAQEKVLRWGFGRWLNYAIERDSPSQYLYQFALATPEYTTDEMVNEFSRQVIQGKPKFIIESINYFIPLDSEKLASYDGYVHPEYYEIIRFVEENYVVVKLKFYAKGQNKEDKWIKIWMLKEGDL